MIKRMMCLIIFCLGLYLLSGCKKVDEEWIENELPRFFYEMIERNLKLSIKDISIEEIEYVYLETKLKPNNSKSISNKSTYVFVSYIYDDEYQSFFGNIQKEITDRGDYSSYNYLGNQREQYDKIIDDIQKESIKAREKDYEFKLISYLKNEKTLSKIEIDDLYEKILEFSNLYGYEALNEVELLFIGGEETLLSMNGEDYLPALSMFNINQTLKDIHGESFTFEKVTSRDGEVFYKYDDANMIQTEDGYLSFRIYIRSQNKYSRISHLQFSTMYKQFAADVSFTNASNFLIIEDTYFGYDSSVILRASLMSHNFESNDPYVITNSYHMLDFDFSKPLDFRELKGMTDYVHKKTGSYPKGSSEVILPNLMHTTDDFPMLELSVKDDYYEGYIDVHIWFEIWDTNSYPFIDMFDFSLFMVID